LLFLRKRPNRVTEGESEARGQNVVQTGQPSKGGIKTQQKQAVRLQRNKPAKNKKKKANCAAAGGTGNRKRMRRQGVEKAGKKKNRGVLQQNPEKTEN